MKCFFWGKAVLPWIIHAFENLVRAGIFIDIMHVVLTTNCNSLGIRINLFNEEGTSQLLYERWPYIAQCLSAPPLIEPFDHCVFGYSRFFQEEARRIVPPACRIGKHNLPASSSIEMYRCLVVLLYLKNNFSMIGIPIPHGIFACVKESTTNTALTSIRHYR